MPKWVIQKLYYLTSGGIKRREGEEEEKEKESEPRAAVHRPGQFSILLKMLKLSGGLHISAWHK